VFLKLLVLLVPREMRVERTGGVKDMSDGQIEAAIEAIQAMLAAREVSENTKVIDTVPEPVALRLHRVSQGASVERRPRLLPPCFPTSRARANSSPASRHIVEGLTRARRSCALSATSTPSWRRLPTTSSCHRWRCPNPRSTGTRLGKS
jgi:hypothetical protein